MTIVVDTSIVLALLDRRDADHAVVRDWIATVDEDLFTSPLAVAEIDHLLAVHGGPVAQRAFWGDLDAGAYTVRWWADGIADTVGVVRGGDGIGLTDASLVALAARLRTTRIATLDHDHFRPLAGPDGRAFTLLPADA
ncbi:MAG: PIN domain-containing protein [Solirubrobacteraceae bacterium]